MAASSFSINFVFICFAASILLTQHNVVTSEEKESPTIGIIGAGIGGTSAAYFLRENFPDSKIDIFEKSTIGGRLATVSISGEEYEAGGSIIHPENFYMTYFAKLLELEQVFEGSHGTLGLYNGEEIFFQTSQYKPVTMAKFFWRYGLDMYKLNSWVEEVIAKVVRIYSIQEKGLSFTNVEELIKAMDASFFNYTRSSIRDVLADIGISNLLIDELITGGMRTNYGQMADIHALVGAVSLCGIQSGLWRVKGGNKVIPQKLLELSKASLQNTEVLTVRLVSDENDNAQYEVVYRSPNDKENVLSKEYDIVIVATPLWKGNPGLKFEDFPTTFDEFQFPHHETVANFIEGNPNISYFGYKNDYDYPSAVFTNKKDLFFNSIGIHFPVSSTGEGKSMWKVFTNQVVGEDKLKHLFPNRKDFRSIPWKAYPEYSSTQDLQSFVMHDRMYYINAIELASSAMEMIAVSAKNAALLAYNHWHGKFDLIDETTQPPKETDDERSDL